MALKYLLDNTHVGASSNVTRDASIMATKNVAASFRSDDFGHLVHVLQAENGLTLEVISEDGHRCGLQRDGTREKYFFCWKRVKL